MLLGPSGCGKSTLLNCHRRPARHQRRADLDRRQERHLGGAEGPRHRHGVPVLRALPAMTAEGNLSFGLKMRARAQGRDRPRASRKAAELLQIEPLLEAPAGRALRRPAPARRDRPGAGARRRRVPVRRAALQPRRQAPHRTPGRDQEAAHAARLDHDLRHPRPDRGADARRPHRGDERRRHPAARFAARRSTTGRSTASSPASSARRR